MALDALLRTLARDAGTRRDALLAAARAEAARLRAEADAQLAARRATLLAARERALSAELEEAVAIARDGARARLLAARDAALRRVQERAAAILGAEGTGPAFAPLVAALGRDALGYLEGCPAVVACDDASAAILAPVLAGNAGARREPAAGHGPGCTVTAADGRVTVDATLRRLLERRWPALAQALVAAGLAEAT